MPDDFATALARKARELTEGMWQRVARYPDIADFRAAFLPIIGLYLAADAKDAIPRASTAMCQEPGCEQRAIFIKLGKALCFQHRDNYGTPARSE